jgi:ATP-binding cassette subfamily F protein 3
MRAIRAVCAAALEDGFRVNDAAVGGLGIDAATSGALEAALTARFDAFTLEYVEETLLETMESSAEEAAECVEAFLVDAWWGEAGEAATAAARIRKWCARAMVILSSSETGEGCVRNDEDSRRGHPPGPSSSLNETRTSAGAESTNESTRTSQSRRRERNETTKDWTTGVSSAIRAEFDASTAREEIKRRPRDEDVVRECVTRAFGSNVDAFLDEDAMQYLASLVAEDVDESDGSFEDALSSVVDAYDIRVDSVGELAQRLRESLDERATSEVIKTANAASAASAGAPSAVRKLANVVKIGGDEFKGRRDSADAAGGLVGGSAFWEQEQRKQQLEEEQRMTALAKSNAEAVEQKRKKRNEKAAKARAKAREEQLADEIRNMEQLTINAAYSKGASGKIGSRDISVAEFSMPHPRGGDDLLEGTSLSLMHGHRYGLTGRNGCGKSTLLRLISRKRVPGVPVDLRVMYVAQDSSDDFVSCDLDPVSVLVQADTRRELLSKQLKELQEHEDAAVDGAIDKRMREIVDELKAIGAEDAPERARKVLRGLQFTSAMLQRPVSSLSGGWRVRVSLARALFVNPDCLMLDEPTNHLDLEAVLWLESYLCGNAFDGRTLVVVSHDRNFLDAVCTDVLAISNKKLTAYAGDYATYEAVRDEQAARQQKMYDEQQAKKKAMQKFVDKHLHKGTSSMFDDGNAKKAKEMMKKMDRMGAMGHDGKKWKLSYDGAQKELTAPEVEVGQFKFSFPEPACPLSSTESVQLRDVSFAYPDCPTLLKDLSMPFDCETRLALVGRNGAGKSTLMKLLMGSLDPSSGNIFRSAKLKVAYVTQHHVDQLNLTMTPLEYVLHTSGVSVSSARVAPEIEQDARRRLGRFGISGPLQTQTIGLLSGGQRSRVAWAVATWESPHILLLDEPTNHLDYESVNALIDAVNAFDGGVVFVSHDEHFVTSIANASVLEITGDGAPGFVAFNDDFDAYKSKALRALKKWT